LVHGNLKLAHLLLYPVPNGPVMLRVADYGLGRLRCSVSCNRRPTSPLPGPAAGLARGTGNPVWPRPRCFRGRSPGRPMMSGRSGPSLTSLLLADPSAEIDADWRERLAERQVPQALLRVVESCLEEQPQRRITAQALVEELTQVLSPKVLTVLTADPVEEGLQDSPAERTRQVKERVRRLHERARQLEQQADLRRRRRPPGGGSPAAAGSQPPRIAVPKRDRVQQLEPGDYRLPASRQSPGTARSGRGTAPAQADARRTAGIAQRIVREREPIRRAAEKSLPSPRTSRRVYPASFPPG